MNISPINLAAVEPQTKSEERARKYALKDAPVPEQPKDEVSFKGGTSIAEFDKVIRKAVSKKIGSLADCESLFNFMKKPIYINDAYTRNEIMGVGSNYEFNLLLGENSYSLVDSMKKLVGKIAPNNDFERGLIQEIQEKSAKGELVLEKADIDLGLDVQPLIRLRRNSVIEGIRKSENFLIPENQYELVFSTSKGGSEVIMGVTKDGEISVKQISNMGVPKYTLFHNDKRGNVKIFTSGNYEDGNFVGKYYFRNGIYNPILSLFLH